MLHHRYFFELFPSLGPLHLLFPLPGMPSLQSSLLLGPSHPLVLGLHAGSLSPQAWHPVLFLDNIIERMHILTCACTWLSSQVWASEYRISFYLRFCFRPSCAWSCDRSLVHSSWTSQGWRSCLSVTLDRELLKTAVPLPFLTLPTQQLACWVNDREREMCGILLREDKGSEGTLPVLENLRHMILEGQCVGNRADGQVVLK